MQERDAPSVLIVGGCGRVGRMLARIWAGREGITYQSRSERADLAWDPLQGPGPFIDWVDRQGASPSMVVLAGVTPTSGVDMAANEALAEACCDAALKAGAPRVLYASTSAVYGPGSGTPFAEADTPAPINAYGRTKLVGEACLSAYRDKGLSATTLRIGNIAGTDQLLVNAGRATRNAPVKLDRFADGAGPRRSYIGAETFARVLETLLDAPDLPDALNVGAPTPVQMEDLLEATGTPWEWVPAPATALQDVTLDCTRLAMLHRFAADESEPKTMIAQWCRFGDAA